MKRKQNPLDLWKSRVQRYVDDDAKTTQRIPPPLYTRNQPTIKLRDKSQIIQANISKRINPNQYKNSNRQDNNQQSFLDSYKPKQVKIGIKQIQPSIANTLDNIIKEQSKLENVFAFPACEERAMQHKLQTKYKSSRLQVQSAFPRLRTSDSNECQIFQSIEPETINSGQINLCKTVTNKPFLMNSGLSQFFLFIQMAIIYIFLRLMIVQIFNISTNATAHNDCYVITPQRCYDSIFTKTSIFNKKDQKDMLIVGDILNLLMILLTIPFFLYYRIKQDQLYNEINDNQQTQDDYTLFINNIPIIDVEKKYKYKKKLTQLLENKIKEWIQKKQIDNENGLIYRDYIKIWQKKELKIVTSINMCFDLSEYYKIIDMKQELANSLEAVYLQKGKDMQSQSLLIRQKMRVLNKIEVQLSSRLNSTENNLQKVVHFLGSAFVSFQYQHYRQVLLQMSKKNPQSFKIDGNIIKLQRANAPRGIRWKNLSVPDQKRINKIRTSYLVLSSILFVSFLISLAIDQIQKFTTQGQDYTRNGLVTIGISLVTLAIDYFLSQVISQLTIYQEQSSYSKQFFSLFFKIFISQFINNAMICMISSYFLDQDYLSDSGLAVKVSSIIVLNAIMENILGLIDVGNSTRRFKNWYKYRKIQKQGKPGCFNTFQFKLNQQYEFKQFNIAERYAYYLVQIYSVFFYAYLVPLCIPILLILLGIQYWIDKYNLLRRSQYNYNLDYFLGRSILKTFEVSVLFLCIGNLIFSHYIENQINWIHFLTFGLYSIYCMTALADANIHQYISNNKPNLERQSYSQAQKKLKFYHTYWQENPATRYLDKKKQVVSKEKSSQNSTDSPIFARVTEPNINDERTEKKHQSYSIKKMSNLFITQLQCQNKTQNCLLFYIFCFAIIDIQLSYDLIFSRIIFSHILAFYSFSDCYYPFYHCFDCFGILRFDCFDILHFDCFDILRFGCFDILNSFPCNCCPDSCQFFFYLNILVFVSTRLLNLSGPRNLPQGTSLAPQKACPLKVSH